MVCAAVFEIGALIQILSFGHRGAIYAGRFIGGWGVGAACLIIPIYIAETSPPAIRGRLVEFFEIMCIYPILRPTYIVQIGAVFGFWILYGVNRNLPSNNQQWMIPFALQLIPSGVRFFGMLLCKETPRYLAKSGNWETSATSHQITNILPMKSTICELNLNMKLNGLMDRPFLNNLKSWE